MRYNKLNQDALDSKTAHLWVVFRPSHQTVLARFSTANVLSVFASTSIACSCGTLLFPFQQRVYFIVFGGSTQDSNAPDPGIAIRKVIQPIGAETPR